MRSLKMIAAAAAAFALTAAAQEEAPPETGLSDLEATVNALQDEAPDAEPVEEESPAEEPVAEEPIADEPVAEEAVAEEPLGEEAVIDVEEAVIEEAVSGESGAEPPAESAPEAPEEPAGPPPPLTAEETAALDRIVARGRELIGIARAGLIATQDMLSRVSDPEGAGIAGWLAVAEGNATSVTFYAPGEDGPVTVYRAAILGGRVTSRDVYLAGTRPHLPTRQARMAAARAATDALDHQSCADQPFNVLVVPPEAADETVTVYQMTPATGPGRFPLGGHFRSVVAAEGTLAEARGFTNACLTVEAAEEPAGARPRPIAVTHLLDPMPTEIHVFLAAWTGRPLVVATGDPQRLWLVTGDRIAEIRE